MTKEEIIKEIENPKNWMYAKHRYAEILLKEFDSEQTRDYLFNTFKETGDYFYNKLLKDNS